MCQGKSNRIDDRQGKGMADMAGQSISMEGSISSWLLVHQSPDLNDWYRHPELQDGRRCRQDDLKQVI